MAKFLCLFLVLAAMAQSGLCKLKCYDCDSTKQDGCLKSGGSLKEQECGAVVQGFKSVCYYRELHDKDNKEFKVTAKCGSIAESTKDSDFMECKSTDPKLTQVKECRVCHTDLCNSSPAISSTMALLCLPAMYLFTKFLY